MPDTTTGIADYEPLTGWVTDEARLLAHICNELIDIRMILTRVDAGTTEFLPPLRALLGRRTARAAAAAGSVWRPRGAPGHD